MTGSLEARRDWLLAEGVTIAAMESASTYWKAPFSCLEEVMDTWLLNAAHIQAVPGRKTDVKDAEWIAQLLECGLVRPSFVPPPDIRRLRMLTRYRVQLMGDRNRESTRLELMLEDASIKLSSVAASLSSVSARAMLNALIAVSATRRPGGSGQDPDAAQDPGPERGVDRGTSTPGTPSWRAACCTASSWSRTRSPSSTRSSRPPAAPGRMSWSCCRPSRESGRRSHR